VQLLAVSSPLIGGDSSVGVMNELYALYEIICLVFPELLTDRYEQDNPLMERLAQKMRSIQAMEKPK